MPRKLRPDERELWDKVRQTANPLSPRPKTVERPVLDPVFDPTPTPAAAPDPIPAFRIGSRAQPKAETKIPSKQSPNMDAKHFRRMSRGRMHPEATLDLHGMTVAEAHPALANFILTAAQRQLRLVLVITGKGKGRADSGPVPERVGVLRQSLPQWLRQPPLAQTILEVTPAHQKHGGGGAFYVYLKRRR